MIFKVHQSYQKTGNRIYQIKNKVYLNPHKCQTTPNQPINSINQSCSLESWQAGMLEGQ